MGYVRRQSCRGRDTRDTPQDARWRTQDPMKEEYGVYMSITGRKLKTYIWKVCYSLKT